MPGDGTRVTYDVDEYFAEQVIEPPSSLEENVNSLGNNNTNETVDGNAVTNTEVTNEQTTDVNTQIDTNVA